MKLLPPILFLVGLLVSACEPEKAVRVQLTPEQRDAFQAIAAARIDSLRPLLDSLCQQSFEDRVAIATDSIVQRRLEEETRLRARLPQITGQ
ncbi:hypothetical protein GGR26_003092 [Lewinella marina]|uniref:Uncharacterized protein n=1 Tax=Neolewinella marina TaxID=438751 RepID=A0A2G0CEG6_9BACT|nr:hypothetical protein [Neolewinella marina]NJB87312.1 hypothetical protein [Neolewinella marina]PHK98368.1 hypothetical protein CGL56_11770 [Neolewinella marina]